MEQLFSSCLFIVDKLAVLDGDQSVRQAAAALSSLLSDQLQVETIAETSTSQSPHLCSLQRTFVFEISAKYNRNNCVCDSTLTLRLSLGASSFWVLTTSAFGFPVV